MRVVMYSPDSIGLGHTRRNTAIATEFVKQFPEASVALVVGTAASALFEPPKGIDTIKLPSIQKIAADGWKARSLNMSAAETATVRSGLIYNAVSSIKPDALLVDHLPLGVCGDLIPTIKFLRSYRPSTRIILGLRDILDSPEKIRARWAQQGQYEFIRAYYDAALVYGDRSVFPSADIYGISECLPGRVTYTGYVCSAAESARDTGANATMKQSLAGLGAWRTSEKLIVIAGGGGNDAYPMMSATLSALEELDGDATLRAVMITGPLMPSEHRQELQARCKSLARTTLVPWTADCFDYLSAAHVAVVMAGYNSALEALSSSANVIMMPRPGPSSEQRIRAQMLAARGLVECIEQHEATGPRVKAAIQGALRKPRRTPDLVMLSGASKAAWSIADHIRGKGTETPEVSPAKRSAYVVF